MLESLLEAIFGRCRAWSSKPVGDVKAWPVGSTPTSFRHLGGHPKAANGRLDQFEGELAATPSSLWGKIRVAGTRLTVLHASLWLVVLPLFLWLARMERSTGNEAWARRRGYRLRGKRHTGILRWIFAALYGMHAILVVAGAPIQFAGKWLPLNMLLPVCGYGLLSFLAAHAYSPLGAAQA